MRVSAPVREVLAHDAGVAASSLALRRRTTARRAIWGNRRGAATIEYLVVLSLVALALVGALRALGTSVQRAADSQVRAIASSTWDNKQGGASVPHEAVPRGDIPPPPPPQRPPPKARDEGGGFGGFLEGALDFAIEMSPIGDVKTLMDPNASTFDKVLAGVSLVSSVIPGAGQVVKGATVGIKVARAANKASDASDKARDGKRASDEAEDGADVVGGGKKRDQDRGDEDHPDESGKEADGAEAPDDVEPPKSGETSATRTGKQVHKQRADERRASGDFDAVNEPIKDKNGNDIEVPYRTDPKTGEPVGDRTQRAQPDAVSYKRGEIIDDKPAGRPISKDRQEIIRFIQAYEAREGKRPNKIIIERYDPKTGNPAGHEEYSPDEFLPP